MESTDYDVMQWWGLNLDLQGNRRKPKTGTLLYDVLNLFASTFMSRKISLESGHPPRKTPNTQTNQPTKTKTKNMLAHLIPKKTHIPIKQKAFSLKKSCNVLFGKHQVLLIQQHNYTDASRLTYGKASLSKSLMTDFNCVFGSAIVWRNKALWNRCYIPCAKVSVAGVPLLAGQVLASNLCSVFCSLFLRCQRLKAFVLWKIII